MSALHARLATLAFAVAVSVASAPSFAADAFSNTAGEPSRRGQELYDLRRQDVATQLAARGVTASWQQQDLAELIDWRERFDAARALRDQLGLELDWRAFPLTALTDMRLRAAKAGELQARYGIAVDWRRYSWNALERLRLSLVALHPATAEQRAWEGDALAPFDPSRRAPRIRPTVHDRDAIAEPLFASAATIRADRGLVNRGPRSGDPDGVLTPTFVRSPRRTDGQPNDLRSDALIDPWRGR